MTHVGKLIKAGAVTRERAAVDVSVEHALGLVVLRPQTERGRDWIAAHVEAEPWQWAAGRLCIDGARYADAIVTAMAADGIVTGGAR